MKELLLTNGMIKCNCIQALVKTQKYPVYTLIDWYCDIYHDTWYGKVDCDVDFGYIVQH